MLPFKRSGALPDQGSVPQRGKHWLELYRDALGYTFKHDTGGGNLAAVTEGKALAAMTQWLTRNTLGTLKLASPVRAE